MEHERALFRRSLVELTLTIVLVWTFAPLSWKVWSVPIAFLVLLAILFYYRPDAMAWRALERETRRPR